MTTTIELNSTELTGYGLIVTTSAAYALAISTPQGKAWVQEHTTASVIIGSGLIINGLALILPRQWWGRVVAAFVVAGLPMIIRKVLKGS